MTELSLPATLVDAIRLATEFDNTWNANPGETYTARNVVEYTRNPQNGCTHDDIDGAMGDGIHGKADGLAYRVAFHAILAATDEEISAALTLL